MASGPPTIFSPARRTARALRHQRFARSAPGGRPDRAAQFVRADMAEDIAERFDFMQIAPSRALILGDAPGLLGEALSERGFEIRQCGPDELDEQRPYPDQSFQIIANLCSLDTINDLPGALIHIRNALPAGGLFFGSFLGHGSLPTLRSILLAADGEQPAARLHPQIDIVAASALMQRAGFARQVVDSHAIEASYRSFEQLVADLRTQGLTNVLADPPPPLTRTALARARAAFAELAEDQGRVTETFEILTLTGWR